MSGGDGGIRTPVQKSYLTTSFTGLIHSDIHSRLKWIRARMKLHILCHVHTYAGYEHQARKMTLDPFSSGREIGKRVMLIKLGKYHGRCGNVESRCNQGSDAVNNAFGSCCF